MKLKPATTRITNIFLISACLLIDIGYFIYENPFLKHLRTDIHTSVSTWANNLKPIDPPISPDLPHNKFEELKQKQHITRLIKNGEYSIGSWNFFNIVGTGGDKICDSCDFTTTPPTKQYFYISLLGWKLKSIAKDEPFLDSVVFHVEKGQPYIRKSFTGRNERGFFEELKDVPVKFMYSHKLQLLKIPVSKSSKDTITIIMQIAIALFILLGLYAALMFVKLIISLRDGSDFNGRNSFLLGLTIVFIFPLFLVLELFKLLRREILNDHSINDVSHDPERLVFTDENIFRLQVLAYTLTGFPIFLFIVNLLLRLIFNSYFTNDVVLNAARLYPWLITMHVGIIFLLLLNAFKQGKALKDEQDLTV